MKLIFFKKIFLGMLAGAAVCAVLLSIFTAVLSGQDDPNAMMGVFSLISLVAGAIVCGKTATAGLSARALQGLASGVCFAVLILLPSVLLSDFDGMSVVKMLAVVVLAFAGAMVYKRGGTKTASAKARRNIVKRYAR